MRLLEEHNPDVTFDWGRLLKSQPPPAGPAPQSSREERRRERRGRGGHATDAPVATDVTEHTDSGLTNMSESPEPEAENREPEAGSWAPEPAPAPAPESAPEPEPALAPAPAADEPVEPRYARLGAAGLARLRRRFADIRGRIEAREGEAERTELLAKAERLNPDAWQTDDEVAHALEEYEVVFEALRPLVGREPRSRRG